MQITWLHLNISKNTKTAKTDKQIINVYTSIFYIIIYYNVTTCDINLKQLELVILPVILNLKRFDYT